MKKEEKPQKIFKTIKLMHPSKSRVILVAVNDDKPVC